ncbi:MAG: prepilin-type N-terminal cleavage/methylation domain-containing protein [Thermoanaerobaculia bacterium]|nr:prepilin-type N-terminal cleavage/methylation domain-containing protein [Thermoanaerobaculia bacterium]
MLRARKLQQGMTLVELLIVVAIVGVLAAIAIVNYMVALDKAKQKKTMADMRSIASAWEARATDRGSYSAAGQAAAFVWPGEGISGAVLEDLLNPTYIRPMARADGWGRAFEFGLDVAVGSASGASIYAIRSAGRDGIFESSYPDETTTRFECDIVFSNGQFVVVPVVK